MCSAMLDTLGCPSKFQLLLYSRSVKVAFDTHLHVCATTSSKYWLRKLISSLCVPFSMTLPLLTTAIVSAWRMVLKRCAIMMVVRFCLVMILSSAFCTICSLSLSSAEVASSSSRIDGLRTIARAIATRCFCPPDSCPPRMPTWVSYSFSRVITKACALASLAASSTSELVAPSLPYIMFSAIVPMKSTGSCRTRPICSLNHRKLSVWMLMPSSSTSPDCGS
mmetsp:Transcript_9797/g.16269  ORF Transcript_9797/g.16269 Transcript_9797/m.16269 type:complete len:222 (-) Transcript_9797:1812-2477(-)